MSDDSNKTPRAKHRHLVKPGWIRIPLKALLWIVVAIALLPVLIYLPPVQSVLKDAACRIASDATGMKISIGHFGLKWPLDVALDDVLVIEASGDTMVRAREVIADVKLRPLFQKDVRLNALRLVDGYYRMVSPDSSMILTIDAGLLDVDGKSSFDIARMHLDLNKARLKDGSVSMYTDVWKKVPKADKDTAQSPFLITARDLKLENFTFAMSMLPTIDTLRFNTSSLALHDAVIDLGKSEIKAGYLGADGGDMTFLTPTAEYIKAHPAPIDTITPPSPPMTIMADSVSLDGFSVLYGVKGARPAHGFDASCIQVSNLSVGLRDFFNRESTIRLPITRLLAKERCGLQIVSGSGLVGIDSIGLNVNNINLATPNSHIMASASVPFALMAMKPNAAMSVEAAADIGLHDIEMFMPTLRQYTSLLSPARKALLNVNAAGTLASLNVGRLDVDIPSIFSLHASGHVDNPMDVKRLRGAVDFNGALRSPAVVRKFVAMKGVEIPTFAIRGHASAQGNTYAADFNLQSSAGNVNADGRVSLSAESYRADVTLHNFNVGHIMPSLGVGAIDGHLTACGAGFNPTRRGASTDITLAINSAGYGKHVYRGIHGGVSLHGGVYDVDLTSADPDARFDVKGSGSIADDDYSVDLRARIDRLDLQALGFSEQMNEGSADIYVVGSAQPGKWLYDVDLTVDNFDWNMPDAYYHLPAGVKARLLSTPESVDAWLASDGLNLDFNSPTGLKQVADKFMAASESVQKQIEQKSIDFKVLEDILPEFALHLDANGDGVARQLLEPMGYNIDSLNINLNNADSLLTAKGGVLGFSNGSLLIDSLTLNAATRGAMMDYEIHMGNRPGNMPEFAKVDLSGYVGGNRASASLKQINERGETGYRLGFTAALSDSTVTVHFTPLKATIAYLPWTFNIDNHIDYTFGSNRLDANLMATSLASSIFVKTEIDKEDGGDNLHVELNNIRIQDFLAMNINGAPPVKASINSKMHLKYRGTALTGDGTLDLNGLEYNGTKLGDYQANFDAGLDFQGDTRAKASLKINGEEALIINGLIRNGDEENPNDLSVDLNRFPLSMVNAFLDKNTAQLEGVLNGHMSMDGTFDAPRLNGEITFADAAVYVPMMGSRLKFSDSPVSVIDNLVTFDNFAVKGQNDNPLVLDGTVDARNFRKIRCDLKLDGDNFQLVGSNKRGRSDLYGKLFVSLHATATGPLDRFDVNGSLSVLSNTDVFYTIPAAASTLSSTSEDNVVKFVNFTDSTAVAKADTVETAAMNMRVQAALTVQPGTRVTVNLKQSGNDKVVINPSGTLNYFQNYMGDMRLNGQLMLGEGQASYTLPVVGEKKFTIEPGAYVAWNGQVTNPSFSVVANDNMKVNVNDAGNSRLVNFVVSVIASGNVEAPKIAFDLSADGDMSIQNELQSMTADQRSNQAMNLLLYGQYTGPNTTTVASNLGESALYGFLTSQLNSWAANHIRGVDLSFGIDQYENTADGHTSQAMTYSYQVSKSLLNNRFKIVVGGNYSTDASADDNFAENLLSDVSFEYMLKQTNNLSMLVKLFRQYNYESILEGQVSETGVGFVMRRRMSNLRSFFRLGRKNRAKEQPADTLPAAERKDSVVKTINAAN